MPTYFEMLQRASLGSNPNLTALDYVKGMGNTGLLDILLIVTAAAVVLAAVGTRNRRLALLSIVISGGAILTAIAGSYLGYAQASRVVATAATLPKDSALDEAANMMAFSLYAPGLIASFLVIVGLVVAISLGKKAPDRSTAPA